MMALPPEFLRTLHSQLGDSATYPPDVSESLGPSDASPSYDFIVVGLGAAGSAVANRLARHNKDWKVLGLDAGFNPPFEAEIPGLWFCLWQDSLLYKYPSEKRDDAFQGLHEQCTTIIRGKALGGTSTINGMPYVRGHPKDYDSWQEKGIKNWNFEDVLPFFKKFEDMRDERVLDLNPDFHGVGGEMTIEAAKGTDPLKAVIKSAAKELGYEELIDLNGPGELGFGDTHRTQRDGTRCGSAKAFLSNAALGGSQNLHIARNCTASKLVFDRDAKKVIGVEIDVHGKEITRVEATKEVIVCAGGMESPKLLLLSGVGPKEHLQEIGIPEVHDLPVGSELQDHALFPGIVFSVPPLPADNSDPLKSFAEERTGPLSNIGLMELMGFIRTESTKDWDVPSVQFNHVRYPKGRFQSKPLDPEIEDAIKKINADSDILVIMPFLLHPQKSGQIRLRSNNFKDPPEFHSGLFADPRDVEIMREGIEFVEKMSKTKSFQEAGIMLRYVRFPGSDNMIPGSPTYWEHAIRLVGGSAFHPVASCALGSVLDDRLRVKGVKALRVADASAIPSPVSANPNAPAIMVGERAAHFIIEEFS